MHLPVVDAGSLFADESSNIPANWQVHGRRVVVAVFTLLCVRSIDEVHYDEQHDHSDHKPGHEFLGARVRRITHSIADRISRITLRVPNLFVS